MKFTIKDTVDDSPVKMDMVKHPRNRTITLVKDDSREKLIEVSSKGGKLIASVADDIAVGTMSGGAVSTSSPNTKVPDPIDPSGLRNWETVKGKMRVMHPKTGEIMELGVCNPGAPFTPAQDVNEILGQPDMTFSVAYAFAKHKHSMLVGPTGTGKTTLYRWFAKALGWNFVLCPIARGTEAAHLVGDYLPTGQALFEWMDGPVTEAIRLSQDNPTLLVFDEINRIGNVAEFSRIYSVLDDSRVLELKERRVKEGIVERLEVGDLMIGATANPSDDDRADYMGVQDMDPALSSRFGVQPHIDYPAADIELEALCSRVSDVDRSKASRMVSAAKRIRESADVRFPISFRELENWALAEPYFGYNDAAEVTVVNKAPRVFQQSIRNLILAG